MTPNPQNIGAAPEGITLEVGKTYENSDGTIRVWIEDVNPYRVDSMAASGNILRGESLMRGFGPYWHPNGLYHRIDHPGRRPEFDLIREVPSQEGEALPEPKAKGPSLPEVTQPGEGVDLGAVEAYIEDHLASLPGIPERARMYLESLSAEVRSLRSALEGLYDKGWTKEAIEAARVALRRESK